MIGNGLTVSPKELYCLGGVLNAKYIDYAYIAALDDIGQDFGLFKKETLASLVAKGILTEDFSGNMEIDEEYRRLLTPVFFGNVETSLNICTIGEQLTVDIFNYHFYNDRITLVKNQDNSLLLLPMSDEDIHDTVSALVADRYSVESNIRITDFDNAKVTRFFSAKSIDVGVASSVRTFIEHDGILCTETEENGIVSLSREDFINAVYEIIKGAM